MTAEKIVCLVALTLLMIGGLNWGLHAFDLNAVDKLDNLTSSFLGEKNLSKVVYVLVALAAVYVFVQVFINKKIKACPDEDQN